MTLTLIVLNPFCATRAYDVTGKVVSFCLSVMLCSFLLKPSLSPIHSYTQQTYPKRPFWSAFNRFSPQVLGRHYTKMHHCRQLCPSRTRLVMQQIDRHVFTSLGNYRAVSHQCTTSTVYFKHSAESVGCGLYAHAVQTKPNNSSAEEKKRGEISRQITGF